MIAQHREPAMVFGYLIEFVAVQNQIAFAVGGGVNLVMHHADVAPKEVLICSRRFVMIAGDEDHFHIVAVAFEYFLDHRFVRAIRTRRAGSWPRNR